MSIALKILVVDDEPILREIMKDFLSAVGHYVDLADSGNQAYEMTKKASYNFVITDVQMPNGDGLHLLERVKTLVCAPKVCLVSGYTKISRTEAICRGACDLLTKPIDFTDLLKVMEKNTIVRI